LIVFLAEDCHAGLDAGKKFHDHRADACEETRSKGTFEDVRQAWGGLHLEFLSLWIEFVLVGRKNKIAARLRQLRAVLGEGAGISIKVFVWKKLQAVDKDAGDHRLVTLSCKLYQGQVSCVEIAHGGNETAAAALRQSAAKVGKGVNDVHTSEG